MLYNMEMFRCLMPMKEKKYSLKTSSTLRDEIYTILRALPNVLLPGIKVLTNEACGDCQHDNCKFRYLG
jgi:hypothetical protein